MSVIWEIFVALTDGLGEAASVRVSFYLVEGLSSDARHLSNKICCLAAVLVLFVTSLFLMLGPRIAVLLTTDKVVQSLLNNLVGMTCLANSSMTIAQIYWSLAGAQGRFELASATILFCRWFIIIPLACLVIFQNNFDIEAVAAMVAVGYAVAAFILACKIFLSDWEAIGRSLRGRLGCGDGIYTDGRSNFDNVDASALVDEDRSIFTTTENESTLVSHRVV
jgi:Na+-driven multidrug efflux pump